MQQPAPHRTAQQPARNSACLKASSMPLTGLATAPISPFPMPMTAPVQEVGGDSHQVHMG
jgi:hypothetical protein